MWRLIMPTNLIRTKVSVMITVLLVSVAFGEEQSSSSTRPALDPVVDKILTRLENREVGDLHARVSWELRYVLDLEEDADKKLGRIWYAEADPVPRFLVDFDKQISGNRIRKLDEKHLFDGRWYVELQSRTKTVTRREVRKEEDRGNPYRIGEGVFPLPFGQKKEDILREFEVRRVTKSGPDDPKNADHLQLRPREGSSTAQSYKQLDFWIAQEGKHAGLPVKVVTAKKDGTGKVNSFLTLTFDDIELNKGFSQKIFRIETPPGYEEYVEKLEPVTPPDADSDEKP